MQQQNQKHVAESDEEDEENDSGDDNEVDEDKEEGNKYITENESMEDDKSVVPQVSTWRNDGETIYTLLS